MLSSNLKSPFLTAGALAITLLPSIVGAQEIADLIPQSNMVAVPAVTDGPAQKAAADNQAASVPAKSTQATRRSPLAVGTELIQDGSFEAGSSADAYGFGTLSSYWGWYSSGTFGSTNPRYSNSSTGAAHTGSWALYFDFGPSENQLSQRVTMPANSTTTLSFWLKIGGTSPNALDTLGVNFTDVNGTAIQTFAKNYHYYSDYPGSYRYVYYSYDVSALAGRTGYLLFWTKMYGDTIFMLDDVSLVTTTTAPPPPTGTCTEDPLTMCLVSGRYRVTSHWLNQYASPPAAANLFKTRLSDKTGAFYVTDSATYEYLIRFNTSTNNGKVWIAIPTFTDVEFWVSVTDTVTGQTKDYHSGVGNKTLLYDPNTFPYP